MFVYLNVTIVIRLVVVLNVDSLSIRWFSPNVEELHKTSNDDAKLFSFFYMSGKVSNLIPKFCKCFNVLLCR